MIARPAPITQDLTRRRRDAPAESLDRGRLGAVGERHVAARLTAKTPASALVRTLPEHVFVAYNDAGEP